VRVKIPTWLLLRIAERDHWICHICGQGYIPGDSWEVDHDIPRAKGGTNHIWNLRLAHRRCNRDKAAA
jgi:5-methylcytosine-specific restriction endonuclease McrA